MESGNSVEEMIDALEKETSKGKHEELEEILDEVQDQVQFLHELHQRIDSKE